MWSLLNKMNSFALFRFYRPASISPPGGASLTDGVRAGCTYIFFLTIIQAA
jgi:hypothetical protein